MGSKAFVLLPVWRMIPSAQSSSGSIVFSFRFFSQRGSAHLQGDMIKTSKLADSTIACQVDGFVYLALPPRLRLLGTWRVRMRLSNWQRHFQGLSYKRRSRRFGMGIRASSLRVVRRLCCNRRVLSRVKPWKAPSSTWRIWFCWRSRLVKLSYPRKAPSWRILIRFRARRRCLGFLDQEFAGGMKVSCRSWQSMKIFPDSFSSEQLGDTSPEGPDLLWRRTPRTLTLILKHRKTH